MKLHVLFVAPFLAPLSVAVVGCKKKPDAKPGTTTGGGTGGGTETTGGGPTKPTLQPFGVLDPTPRLSAEAGKSLQAAWKAYKGKAWGDAHKEFGAVIAASPDYVSARWALVRSLVQAGTFGEVPAAFEALIARDFLGYWKKLDEGKEFAALRAAPEWSQIGALKARYSEAFQKGFQSGLFVVVAGRAAKEPTWSKDVAELSQNQEAYHYDLETKRFSRVTDTGGHVQAILASKDLKSVAFLVAEKVVRIREGGAESFIDPKIGVTDLDEMTTVGPAPHKGAAERVVLLQTKDLSWHFGFRVEGKDRFYAFDTAKTGLTELDIDPEAVFVGKTTAAPRELTHLSPVEEGSVEVKSDKEFLVTGSPKRIVATRSLAAGSFAWSPKKNRIAYAGVLDACALAAASAPKDPKAKKKPAADPTEGKNELFVFDKTKDSAQRISQGASHYTARWIDDDKLAFEEGLGAAARVVIYSINDHAPTSLPTRFGAGLYGLPVAQCKTAELAPTTPPPPADGEPETVPEAEAD